MRETDSDSDPNPIDVSEEIIKSIEDLKHGRTASKEEIQSVLKF